MNYRALHDLRLRKGTIQELTHSKTGKTFYVPRKYAPTNYCDICKGIIDEDANICLDCYDRTERIKSKIINIQKSQKDYSKLRPKRTMVIRKGTTYETTVYINPDKDKSKIPTITLKPLPEDLKRENCPTDKFFKKLLEKFRDKKFQNKHTKANILVPRSGIEHSVYNKYNLESVNITRASILQLDQLLRAAIRIKIEINKRSDKNVLQVDTYHAKIKTGNSYHGYRYYGVNLVVKNRKDTGEIFYDHLVINENNKSVRKSLLKRWMGTKDWGNVDAIINGKEYINEQSGSPYLPEYSITIPQRTESGSHSPQPFGINKPYHSNSDKSIKKSLHKKYYPT